TFFCYHRHLHSFPTTTLFRSNSQFMNHVVGYGTYDYLNLFRSENGGESLEQNNFFSGISLRFIDENTGFYYESGLWKTIDSGSRSEEHTSELQSRENLVCRLL